MKTLAIIITTLALANVAQAVSNETANPAANGGVRIDSAGQTDYLRQYPHGAMTATFTGPVRVERHGPYTTVRMNTDGLPGHWLIVNVRAANAPQ